MQSIGLPIEAVLADVGQALAANACTVVQAPPGAGKTTLIPLYLKDSSWLAGKRIMMLAPRRLAARAAARRMADLLGEEVGETVGYRVRMDSRVSAATRIEVVTEGVLTRMLQGDPSLEGVGLVIFDEFHERSLDADLGLALCLDMQGVLNPDLRLLVMSATLDTAPIAVMLGHAPVIDCPGREFPVETRYIGRHTPVLSPAESIDAVFDAVLSAARTEPGNILVFLPGAPEIRRTVKRLGAAALPPEWIIAPLFGNLSQTEQDAAILPPPPGRRKIVLATSIAETSLTIEGIRVVVDSGLSRVPRFDIRGGLTRLATVPVSRASADQRRGRAGRTGPGICIRLWSREMHNTLPAAHRPEILETDLAGLALELAIWGVDDPAGLHWLDMPPGSAFDSARSLLKSLGSLDDQGRITRHGRRMASLPAHPRLAHMLIVGEDIGAAGLACDLAALIEERDPLRFEHRQRDEDMQLRVDLLNAARCKETVNFHQDGGFDESVIRRVIRIAANLRHRLGSPSEDRKTVSVGYLLACAYPDRIAKLRPGTRGRYRLSGGRGAFLDPAAPLSGEPFLVAVELDGEKQEARIYRAAVYRENIEEQFADQIELEEIVEWDPARQAVAARRDLKFGALVLRSEPLAAPDPGRVAAALLAGIKNAGLQCLPWTRSLRSWQERVCFLRRLNDGENWPDVSDVALAQNLEDWLVPFISGITRLRDLSRLDLKAALFNMLPYTRQKRLEELVPTHLVVPSGSRIPIDYSGNEPVLAVRLQEMFGLVQTPSVAGGRQPLLIHFLSPAGRPVQITRDLAGFWKTGYPEIKKELKGRYPKHFWPDDPLHAAPTARVKPKSKNSHAT